MRAFLRRQLLYAGIMSHVGGKTRLLHAINASKNLCVLTKKRKSPPEEGVTLAILSVLEERLREGI